MTIFGDHQPLQPGAQQAVEVESLMVTQRLLVKTNETARSNGG
jgi:hypothetical protein